MNKTRVITIKSSDYPSLLRNIHSPPKQLYVLGNLNSLLDKPRIAIVGSRKVSPYGKVITERFARDIARQGIIIVSGLAYGVDSIAHRKALEQGTPTIAVLPTSLENIYPAVHKGLAMQIIEGGGVLISEYPPGSAALRTNFLARNRIVSGLSDGVLITEAALKSGTLHTAGFALDQGKTVMAVPGNITSPGSEGANNLIKAGALPITSTEDILQALNLKKVPVNTSLFADSKEEADILDLLKNDTCDVNDIIRTLKLDASMVNQTLTLMELNGRVIPLGNGKFGLS